jgi:hypothetical protein
LYNLVFMFIIYNKLSSSTWTIVISFDCQKK